MMIYRFSIALIAVIILIGCEDRFKQVSASGQIISVVKHDAIGQDIQTTVVFDNGQVLSMWKIIGKEGDVVFFDPVTIRIEDSSIVSIPHSSVIKNVTKGREFYGQ